MSSSDRNFWRLTKEIRGLDTQRGTGATSADDLAAHFSEKMSNGKDESEDDYYIPKDSRKVSLSNFKIRLKTVKKVLSSMDPNKSANDIPPRFGRECVAVVAIHVCKLYQYNHCQESEIPFSQEIWQSHCSSQA